MELLVVSFNNNFQGKQQKVSVCATIETTAATSCGQGAEM